MKLITITSIFITLFIFSVISFGQEKPEAVLLDELSRESCDPLKLRVDAFLREIKDDPNSKGFIIVYGEKDANLQNLQYEQLLKDMVSYVRYGVIKNRIEFVHGSNKEKFRIQFWKIPVGADPPSHEKSNWSYSLSQAKKPFIFYEESWGWDICPSRTDLELYSRLLLENSKWRGHLVIYETSIKMFR